MTTPLRESKSELWELIFDLELTERWKNYRDPSQKISVIFRDY